MVDLLPAPFRMNALNVAIPRLTCSDAQRPGWLEVPFGNDISCLLHPNISYAAITFAVQSKSVAVRNR